jgi:mono/diheme cytochrome c family protein
MVSSVFVVTVVAPAAAADRHMMQPRVPADKLAEARALTSPLSDSPDIVEKGRALYHGKGTCFNCHGKDGGGDGPVAAQLDPAPRNFQHHGFWRHRTEGEIFWVIKHGIAETAMIPFGGVLTDEEIWAIIQYERSFAGDHGPGERMGPRHGRGGRERGCCDRLESAQ